MEAFFRDIVIKGIWDAFVKIRRTFLDMVIQSFLNLAEFMCNLPISFHGYGTSLLYQLDQSICILRFIGWYL